MTRPGSNLSECFACAAGDPAHPCERHGDRPDATTAGHAPAQRVPDIGDAVRSRLDAAKAGHPLGPDVVPEHIRAAIHAGHVGQVVIFCDGCGVEEEGDYTGETREDRFAAARRHLAEAKGWGIVPGGDWCPACACEMRREWRENQS